MNTLELINNFINSERLSIEILGNSLREYVMALILFLGLILILWIFKRIVFVRFENIAKKTNIKLDDVFVDIVSSIGSPFYVFVSFYFTSKTIAISSFFKTALDVLLVAFLVYQAIKVVQIFIEYWISKKAVEAEYETDPHAKNALNTVGKLIKASLWVLGGLLVLSNLNVDITSLLAGLGIGGIAIAFAAQNILEDLFSSFAIYFDKPFEVGDMIVVGANRGRVLKIGIKTTRIRSIQGEEIVITNKELTSSVIQNFKKMDERRTEFSFGILYETSNDKLRKIPDIVKNIIEDIPNIRPDRVHFEEFGDSALIYKAVYYVASGEYAEYMDAQQEINLRLKKQFEDLDIQMAYPTQTLYIKK